RSRGWREGCGGRSEGPEGRRQAAFCTDAIVSRQLGKLLARVRLNDRDHDDVAGVDLLRDGELGEWAGGESGAEFENDAVNADHAGFESGRKNRGAGSSDEGVHRVLDAVERRASVRESVGGGGDGCDDRVARAA